MTDLCQRECVPCQGGVPALKGEQITPLIEQLDGWRVPEEHHLSKRYSYPDFAEALAMVNKVGALAEKEGHHPNIHLTWGEVRIDIWTHKIDGLTESDFILAAKIDAL